MKIIEQLKITKQLEKFEHMKINKAMKITEHIKITEDENNRTDKYLNKSQTPEKGETIIRELKIRTGLLKISVKLKITEQLKSEK